MSNPQYLVLFGLLFFLFGAYNVFSGSRRIRQAQEQGITLPWYKQTMLLIGIEYILIAFVCLIRLSVLNKWLPQSLNILVIPAYVVVFIPAAVLAGLIVRQGITNLRQSRQSTASVRMGTGNASRDGDVEDEDNVQHQVLNKQHRRERRQKAAAARRKRAGRA